MIEPARLARYNFRRVRYFGDNLKRLRERQGLTQEALANKLKLKRPTPISIREGARKKFIPKSSTIKKLADALGVQPKDLLEGVETAVDRLRDLPRQTQGTSFASEDHPQGEPTDADAAAADQARVLRKIIGAYETLAAEVQKIHERLGIITTRLRLERDALGLKVRTPRKNTAGRRGNR